MVERHGGMVNASHGSNGKCKSTGSSWPDDLGDSSFVHKKKTGKNQLRCDLQHQNSNEWKKRDGDILIPAARLPAPNCYYYLLLTTYHIPPPPPRLLLLLLLLLLPFPCVKCEDFLCSICIRQLHTKRKRLLL